MMPIRNNGCWLPANWPAPEWIQAGTTTRLSGYSDKPFDSFNLALHVGDDPDHVRKNRKQLIHTLRLPGEPCWLEQVHGNDVIVAEPDDKLHAADGSYTNEANIVCTVLTADCVPLLLCNQAGTEIAAVHVGWRGFCQDIIKTAINKFGDCRSHLIAWLGPHITAANYEVNDEIKEQLINFLPVAEALAFMPSRDGHCYANLTELVKLKLTELGITEIFYSDRCSYTEKQSFYSYRREKNTGRMASLIWIGHRQMGV